MELSTTSQGTLAAVVLDREGIIRSTDFKGDAFDTAFGWPGEDLVGQPFILVHRNHNISVNEIASGVVNVCQGMMERFSTSFEVCLAEQDLVYEVIADHAKPDEVVVTYEEIHERQELIKQQIRQNSIHDALFQHVPIGIMYQNMEGIIELANPAAQKILGLTQSEMQDLTEKTIPWEIYDQHGNFFPMRRYPAFVTMRSKKPQREFILQVKNKQGRDPVWVKANADIVNHSETGEYIGVLTTFSDITHERATQAELQAATDRAEIAIESAQMGVWDWIPETNTMLWDRKLFQIYGYEDETVIDEKAAWRKAIHPDDWPELKREMEDMMTNAREKKVDHRVTLPNGSFRHLRSRAHIIKNTKGEISRVIGVSHDITNSVLSEKKLRELAYNDSTTDTCSRAGLNFRLSRSVARALTSKSKFGVLTMGLCRFKEVNENYGISSGDKVLTEVARRAKSLLGEKDTIARVGGDEFTLVLESIDDEQKLAEFTAAFRAEVLKPVELNQGAMIYLDAAIGVCVFPDDGIDASSLQTNAGLAMFKDKMRDTPSFMRYSLSMSQEVTRKFNLKYQLLSAVKDEEFQLYYQPIVDLSTRTIIGCEALIRWKDNQGNFVSPMEFVPVVEESGLISDLGKWINLTAIKQWKLWQQLHVDLQYISVNVSPRQLENPNFVQELVDMMQMHRVNPDNIQLEITEGTFLKESLNADSMLHQLAKHGFRLAIDDFGTGYSSLAYLKRFNVDVIKIDRSFIQDIEVDQSDRDIVSAILAMNKKLGFKTLVEGIETDKQSDIVRELGCDSAQGYLYGRPTFADEFAELYIRK